MSVIFKNPPVALYELAAISASHVEQVGVRQCLFGRCRAFASMGDLALKADWSGIVYLITHDSGMFILCVMKIKRIRSVSRDAVIFIRTP